MVLRSLLGLVWVLIFFGVLVFVMGIFRTFDVCNVFSLPWFREGKAWEDSMNSIEFLWSNLVGLNA